MMAIPVAYQRRVALRRVVTCWACLVLWLSSSVLLWSGPSALIAHAQAEQADPQSERLAKAALNQAKALLDTNQEDAAVAALKTFIATYSQSAYLDDAYLLLANALGHKKDFEQAVLYLELLLKEFPSSDLAGRARLMLGVAHAELGNTDTALRTLAEARTLDPAPQTNRDARRLAGVILMKRGDFQRAIRSWLDELNLGPEEDREEIRGRIRNVIREKMDTRSLLRLGDAYPTTFPGDAALIRLAELYKEREDVHLAEHTLRMFLIRFPTHEYRVTALDTLRTFESQLKAQRYVIGAVIPTSGRLSRFGTEALNGIRLALERGKDTLGMSNVGLAVKDSAMGKFQLRLELARMLAEYRPVSVIGPLLSSELPLVAGIADRSETPFITPAATMPDVRRLGSYLFSTAITLQQQTRRLAEYAIKRLNYYQFCILYPETPYGQEFARLFSQEVRRLGRDIIAVESYQENDTDLGPQINRLKAEDLRRDGQTIMTEEEDSATRELYIPGFDAIFLPGDPAQIGLITAQLWFHDVKVAFLGANTWNSPDLLRLADRSLEGSIFVDGFFSDSRDPNLHEFVVRYRLRYRSDPTLFAAQAYDATRLVLEALRQGASSGREVRDQLERLQTLPALSGPAAFDSGGTLGRKVLVMQVKQGKVVQID
ncbi:MAG: penicillin-binding protein activator [Nitrospiraceae bacterium]